MGNLTGLLAKIELAVAATKTSGRRDSKNHKFVEDVAELNVGQAIKILRAKSPILQDLGDTGTIKIVGAMYDTATGKVVWR